MTLRLAGSRVVLLAAALLAAVVWASPAWAHAGLVTATPSPGSGIPQPPGEVVLRFDEPLNYRLSGIRVEDDTGEDVAEGPTSEVEGDPMAMKRKLGLLRPGVYSVRWTTVSVLDGHTLKGSYQFGVGTSAAPQDEVADSPLDSEGVLGLAGRFVSLSGLTVWIGVSLLFGRALAAGAPARRLRRLARLAPGLVVGGGAISLLSSAFVAAGSPLAVPAVVSSRSGLLRGGTVLMGAVGTAVGHRRGVSPLLAASAAVFEGASGHAAAAPAPQVATASFALHLGAVGIWTFALVAAAISPRQRLVEVLWSVTPWAIGAAAAVAATGVVSASQVLASPGDLIGSGYGRTLALKGVAFFTMAGLGLVHHRRRKRKQEPQRMETPLRSELGAATLAVLLATILVGFPNPPREAASSEASALVDPVLSKLEQAASFAEASGPFIVGITLIPPKPGEVEVRIQILGAEAGDGPRDAEVKGSNEQGDRFDARLGSCGTTLGCFEGDVSVPGPGKWELAVSVLTNREPIETVSAITLPAPEGSEEFDRAVDSMETLTSAVMTEHLRGSVGGPEVISSYRFMAPDAFEIEVNQRRRIVIGTRSFRMGESSSEWVESTWPGGGFGWPKGYYRDFWRGARGVRILGEGEAGGVPSIILGFVRPDLPAWFRLWIGNDGLVRRQEMRAQGHIMEHVFSNLNAPIEIAPPL